MTRWMVLLAAPLLWLSAQEQKETPPLMKEERPAMIQRLVEVQHQKVNDIAVLLAHPAVSIRPSEPLRAISLYGPKDLVEGLEAEIRRLDKPVMVTSRNIELVAHLMLASPKGSGGGSLPKELEPLAKQLESIFGMKEFRLFETAFLRVREGTPIETSGSTQVPVTEAPVPPSSYLLRSQTTAISNTGASRVIRLDGFRFSIRIPYSTGSAGQFQFSDVGFNTNLDIREGQKVVVGHSKAAQGDSALVLVLTARVVD
jgi:hypothetical protein